jgi:hypothetical protein
MPFLFERVNTDTGRLSGIFPNGSPAGEAERSVNGVASRANAASRAGVFMGLMGKVGGPF